MAITVTPSAPDALPKRPNALWQFIKTQPLGLVGFFIIAIYVVCAIGARTLSPFDPEAIDFTAMLARPGRRALVRHRPVWTRRVLPHRLRLAYGAGGGHHCRGGRLHARGAAWGGFGLLWRAHRQRHPAPRRHHAVVPHHCFGHGGGGYAGQAPAARHRLQPDRRDHPADCAQDGAHGARIILRHITPNIVAPYLSMVSASMAQAILLEASLSFLGLGVTEPTPAWGLMLSGASADFYQTAPWMIVFPGVAITLAVFAFNLFGDSLRDWLDPKLKS
jgi:peptide/nickel transport system permease protein